MKKYYLLIIPFVIACFVSCQQSQSTELPTTIFLIRHAEKTTAPTDPPLSEAGIERKILLNNMLRSVKLSHLFSSNYIRTKETVELLATAQNIKTEIYDPRDLETFAAKLQDMSGSNILVSGHSNSTPELVRLLGGEPGAPIAEKHEYDRLYILTLFPDKKTNTVLLRYGAANIVDGF